MFGVGVLAKKSFTINQLIAVLAIYLAIVFLGLPNITNNLPFGAITGTEESELLVISGSPTFQQGQNQPLSGDVVITTFAVGIGNDIALVGGVQEVDIFGRDIGGIPSDVSFENANFAITGKKIENSTRIPIGSPLSTVQKPKVATNLAAEGGGCEHNIFTGLPEPQCITNVQNQIRESEYSMCANSNGYISFGWKDVPDRVQTGFPLSTTYPRIGVICVSTDSSFTVNNLGAPSTKLDLLFEIHNNKNEVTNQVHLTETQTQAYFKSAGRTIADIRFVGALQTLGERLDLTDETTGRLTLSNGTFRYIFSKDLVNNYNQTRIETRNLALEYKTKQNFDALSSKFDELGITYNLVVDKKRQTIGGDPSSGFPFSVAGEQLIVDDGGSGTPIATLTVLGSWFGIVRSVANLKVTCDEPVIANVGQQTTRNVSVENLSSVSIPYTFSYSCNGGANTVQSSIAGGQVDNIPVSLVFPIGGAGNCVFNLTYPNGSKNCSINYNITELPPNCPNGIADGGENCVNCPSDIVCRDPAVCNTETKLCTNVPPNCNANNVCEPLLGENKSTCPVDCSGGGGTPVCGVFAEGFLYKQVTRVSEQKNFLIDFDFGVFPIKLFEQEPTTVTQTSCELDFGQLLVLLVAGAVSVAVVVVYSNTTKKKKTKRRRGRK